MHNITDFAPRKILCPVDFSELSSLALKYAAAGARMYGSRLTVLHAERFELPRYFAAGETERLVRELGRAKARIEKDLAGHVGGLLGEKAKQINLEYEVAEAHPVDAILQTADRKSADLIVLGTRGLGGAKRLLLGSVAENVVHAAKIPVFTVRQKEHEFVDVTRPGALPRLERILCACEIDGPDAVTLRHAVSLAERFGARLTVLYSSESARPADLSGLKKKLCSWISTTVDTACDLEPLVRSGNAADRIIASARDQADDLIVIGARHRVFREATFLGKTTDLVVRHASVPVLVVPQFAV